MGKTTTRLLVSRSEEVDQVELGVAQSDDPGQRGLGLRLSAVSEKALLVVAQGPCLRGWERGGGG